MGSIFSYSGLVSAEIIVQESLPDENTVVVEISKDERVSMNSKILLTKDGKQCRATVVEINGKDVVLDTAKCSIKEQISVGDKAKISKVGGRINPKKKSGDSEIDEAFLDEFTIKGKKSWMDRYWFLERPSTGNTYIGIDFGTTNYKISIDNEDSSDQQIENKIEFKSIRIYSPINEELQLSLDAANYRFTRKGTSIDVESLRYIGLGFVKSLSDFEGEQSAVSILVYPSLGKPEADKLYDQSRISSAYSLFKKTTAGLLIGDVSLNYYLPYDYESDGDAITLGSQLYVMANGALLISAGKVFLKPYVGIIGKGKKGTYYDYGWGDASDYYEDGSHIQGSLGLDIIYAPNDHFTLSLGYIHSQASYQQTVDWKFMSSGIEESKITTEVNGYSLGLKIQF